jgi:hypothetical protein
VHPDTAKYNEAQARNDRAICQQLAENIDRDLPDAENKIWHGHPVWFLDGNPIVGYSKMKEGVRVLFWSGQSFKEWPKREPLRPPRPGMRRPIRWTRRNSGVGWPRLGRSSGITRT